MQMVFIFIYFEADAEKWLEYTTTEKEVRYLIDETLLGVSQSEKDKIFGEMKKYYNGYLFCADAEVRVFNSNMSLSYLAAYSRNNKPPRALLNASIASDYLKMRNMFALKNKSYNYEVLQEILAGKPQAAAKHQLERYNEAPKFKEMNNLKKWALVFVGDKCVRM